MSQRKIREILEYFGRSDLLPPIPRPKRKSKRKSKRKTRPKKRYGKGAKARRECQTLGIVYYRDPPSGTPKGTGWHPGLWRRGWWLPENEDGEPEYLGLTAIEALWKYHQR